MKEVNDSQGRIILAELLVSDNSSPSFTADTLFRYFSCLGGIFLPGVPENSTPVYVEVGPPSIGNVSTKEGSGEADLNFADSEKELAGAAAIPVLAIAVFAAGGAGMISYTKIMQWRQTLDVRPEDEETKATGDHEVSEQEDEDEVSLDVINGGQGKTAITSRSAELLRELKITQLREKRLRKLSAMSLQKLFHQEEKQIEILTEVKELSNIHQKLRAATEVGGPDGKVFDTVLKDLDSDGSGALDQEQFNQILRTRLKISTDAVSRHELELLFENLDKDGHGFVDTSELTRFLVSDDPVGAATDIVQEGLARLSQQRVSFAWQAPDSPTEGEGDAKKAKLRRGLGIIELAELLETSDPVSSFAKAGDIPVASPSSGSSRTSPNPSTRLSDEDSTKPPSSARAPKLVQPLKVYTPLQTSPSSVTGSECSKNPKLRPCKVQDFSTPGTPGSVDTRTSPSPSSEGHAKIQPCRLQMAASAPDRDLELVSPGPSPRQSDEVSPSSTQAGAPKYIKPVRFYTPREMPEGGSELIRISPCRLQAVTLPGTPDSGFDKADGLKQIKPIRVFTPSKVTAADSEPTSPEGSEHIKNPDLRPCRLQRAPLPGTPDDDFSPYSMVAVARSSPRGSS